MPRRFPLSLLALCLAVVAGRPAVAQSLLDWKWMAQATSAEVQALLDRGADIRARNKDGYTPLHWAAAYSNTLVVSLLLARGADITAQDKNGGTPLHLAAVGSKTPAVVGLLLDRGADITARNKFGHTPLYYAVKNEHLWDTDVYRRLSRSLR